MSLSTLVFFKLVPPVMIQQGLVFTFDFKGRGKEKKGVSGTIDGRREMEGCSLVVGGDMYQAWLC